MKLSAAGQPILFVVVLAAVGALLIYVPGVLVEKYQIVKELGSFWGGLYLAVVGTGAIALLASGGGGVGKMWGAARRKRQRRMRRAKNPSQLSRDELTAEMQHNLDAAAQVATADDTNSLVRQELTPEISRLLAKREAQQLEIVAFGTISSGKSSLLNMLAGREVFSTDLRGGTTMQRNEIPWPGHDRITLVDTPGLGEVDGSQRASIAADAAIDADMVLLVVDGPLRQTEFELLQKLHAMEKRILICLNKEDWYAPSERDELIQQIQEQTTAIVQSEDVVALRSRSTSRRRVRILPDGSQAEEEVTIPPEIQPLADRMLRIVKRNGTDLLMANLLLQSRGLMDEAKLRVRESLDQRAWQIVEWYMWRAGGAAALSPFPFVDLAVGCAISTKMVVDLARVYRQDIDFNLASQLLGQQGKNLISILGTNAIQPAIAMMVGSLLKTVPGVGTLTGGALQGIVQALVTRWIGAVFIEYFKQESADPGAGLAEITRQQWGRMTSIEELRRLVANARQMRTEAATETDETP
ncbi:MAG: DUF697 domain-containing protein [Planctomycetota bacterium]|nr:DUF697 domain-containing protein [Planctomycetota bacterium]